MPKRIIQGRWFALLLCLMAFSSRPASAQNKEYQVKAAFLYNFSHFVEWPAAAFPEPQSPLVIGVLGEDPFGHDLDELVQGEKVNNHPLAVKRFRRVEDVKNCQMLFVGASDPRELERTFSALKGQSILTVGDADKFALQGGMIRFVTENHKIRLKIDLEAAKAANLTISSKLLRAAEIVAPGKE